MFTHVDLKYKPRQVQQTSDPYLSLMSKEEVTKARNFHRTFPQYQETPLRSLKQMASYLGLGTVAVKDESFRYGLNSFKALGGAYAMGRFLADEVGRDISELSYSVLTDEHFLKTLAPCTFFSATDGNHGRGVAWTARMLHQRCVILMPKGTAKSRFDNIRALGAEVTIEDLNYDECVRKAARLAEETPHSVIVQDTSWPGYFDIPSWIMQGYGVMADEAAEQLGTRPTHVFVQAGVGCMAGAVTGYFSALYPDNPPKIIVVEPHAADCMYRSNEKGDGSRVIVEGDMDSCMAGLACGEPCEIGWDLFRNHATGFISGEDRMTLRGMRMLAGCFRDDPHITSGESGAATFGALATIMMEDCYSDIRRELGLGPDSTVLCFSTEGDTDPVHYKQVVWEGLD
ncbi:diaminopropionate ammonia-lyase [Porcincola intestinalis]|uniref:diaminopropionate ammonia-lyase n=1 Tax=Porcincola intestinalis TaxID=2606632 RepID=UPI0023F52AF2|nr:diaminopropionate ammonia-lyase [Porcincola intestinalis]MDD7061262.1 diaminopropionate ammonia-lyase [Porcincola intestinalis]MDY5284389.1 diaminopropionate ammonia-lyase [Porcincola intestinalis]